MRAGQTVGELGLTASEMGRNRQPLKIFRIERSIAIGLQVVLASPEGALSRIGRTTDPRRSRV